MQRDLKHVVSVLDLNDFAVCVKADFFRRLTMFKSFPLKEGHCELVRMGLHDG